MREKFIIPGRHACTDKRTGAGRRKKTCGRLFGLGLAAAAALTAAGCGDGDAQMDSRAETWEESGNTGTQPQRKEDGMEGVKSGDRGSVTGEILEPEEDREKIMDFGLSLLMHTMEEGENTLISPLSVISALTMTANGAKGETLRQMEEVFGTSASELSAYLSAYMEALPESDKYKLSMANSIWFTDHERFTVEQDFLEKNSDYFQAGLYKVPFDSSTAKEINRWVEENTDGMIREIVDTVPPNAVMYLVNALAFDAQWQNIYYDYQVRQGDFTGEDGTVRQVELMYSTEHRYLEDDSAVGFLKYYEDGKYAYAALLPKEGVTVSEYVTSLTGEKLREILDNSIEATVYAAIPKYESEYAAELRAVLAEMGMGNAFDADMADFSGIGTSSAGNIFINRVLHKTYIAVDERGTRAGAATVTEMTDGASMPMDPKTIYLDRPFLYMIIDCDTNLPVFMGICRQINDNN